MKLVGDFQGQIGRMQFGVFRPGRWFHKRHIGNERIEGGIQSLIAGTAEELLRFTRRYFILKIRFPMNRAAFFRVSKRLKNLHERKQCYAPDDLCSGKIVRAHTLSEKLMLGPISRNGHVYTYTFEAKPTDVVRDQIQFVLRGVNQTSIFYGFCQKHDRDLFSCIETEPFICSRKQLATLYFRALAREYHSKLQQLEARMTQDELKAVYEIPENQEIVPRPGDLFFVPGTLKAQMEIHDLKERVDGIFAAEEYSRIISQVFVIDGVFPVACAGITNPDFDFDGNLIQNISDLDLVCELISYSVVVDGAISYVILSYLDIHAGLAEKFISSLVSREDVAADLIWMTFCHFENTAYSPEWIESLSDELKDELMRATFDNINKFDPEFGIIADRKMGIPCPKFVSTFRV